MKTYISILLLLIMSMVKAQEIIVPLEDKFTFNDLSVTDPIYYKDINNRLTKFTGTWIYNDGTHYLKIKVTKLTHMAIGTPGVYNDPNFEDGLMVDVLYKLNGNEVYDTESTNNVKSVGNLLEGTNSVLLYYYEPTQSCIRQKKAELLLTFIPDRSQGLVTIGPSPGTLHWVREAIINCGITPLDECPDGSLVDSSDFKIPADLILERE